MNPSISSPLDAIVICGPSGAGKGTLLKRLFNEFGDRFAFSISHTTRQPRAGEVNGREYHFVDADTIIQMNSNNEFLELCLVHNNFYGTSVQAIKSIQSTGKVCMLEIDVEGAVKLRHREKPVLNMIFIFISAPMEELRKRILSRAVEDDAVIQRRLDTAVNEYKFLEENPEFFTQVIANDDLDRAYRKFIETISEELEKHGMAPL